MPKLERKVVASAAELACVVVGGGLKTTYYYVSLSVDYGVDLISSLISCHCSLQIRKWRTGSCRRHPEFSDSAVTSNVRGDLHRPGLLALSFRKAKGEERKNIFAGRPLVRSRNVSIRVEEGSFSVCRWSALCVVPVKASVPCACVPIERTGGSTLRLDRPTRRRVADFDTDVG